MEQDPDLGVVGDGVGKWATRQGPDTRNVVARDTLPHQGAAYKAGRPRDNDFHGSQGS